MNAKETNQKAWQGTSLSRELIGRTFEHYLNNRQYLITGIYQTKSLTTGCLISETYVTQNFCMGQLVQGEMPWSTIKRSVSKNGWLERPDLSKKGGV